MVSMARHLTVLTNSSLTTFRRCPREYQFAYVLNRKSRSKSTALKFGSLYHAGLNDWFRGRAPIGDEDLGTARMRHAIDAMHEHALDNETDPFEMVKAECLMVGYTARWGNEPYETIAVEKRFSVPIVTADSRAPSFNLKGSIDALVQKPVVTGRSVTVYTMHNVESKTTSSDISAGSDYWRRVVALDSQVSTYNAAAKSMGFDVRDTIYDVTRKPELMPLRATPEESKKYTMPTKAQPIPRLYANQRESDETPEEYRARLTEDIIARPDWYFARTTIVRLEHDDEEHARDVVQTANAIRFAEDNDAWPRSPNACERWRNLCSYFPVCSGETSIDDGTRFETKTAQHEELSE